MWRYLSNSLSPIARPAEYFIAIKVSDGENKKLVIVNSAALRACSFLKANLVDGSTISSVHPAIFQIVIDYLNANYELTRLTLGPRPLLKFAQVWMLARAIELPSLQNQLLETFRHHYLHLLTKRKHIEASCEPLEYLRDRVGSHTAAEKFIIDFYAGLLDETTMHSVGRLPDDVKKHVLDRWKLIKESREKFDRIAIDPMYFRVPSKPLPMREKRWVLRIVSPVAHAEETQNTVRSMSTSTQQEVHPSRSPPMSPRLIPLPPTPALRPVEDEDKDTDEESSSGDDVMEICYFPEFARSRMVNPRRVNRTSP